MSSMETEADDWDQVLPRIETREEEPAYLHARLVGALAVIAALVCLAYAKDHAFSAEGDATLTPMSETIDAEEREAGLDGPTLWDAR